MPLLWKQSTKYLNPSGVPYLEVGALGEIVLGRVSLFLNLENILNVRQSGYNPMLLKFLESGFDGKKFLERLLEDYADSISK